MGVFAVAKMESLAAFPSGTTTTTSLGFVSWEEVFVSSDKRRREVHYFLKRRDGSSDLAVIGKERSLRHMSYHYAIRNPSFVSAGPFTSFAKLKSRREVVDWLNAIVSDLPLNDTSRPPGGYLDSEDACQLDIETYKNVQQLKPGQHSRDFLWLGTHWTSRKRRRHYQSFCRNGIKISVYDFVYVLAEEGQRLVAYLEDMYEDSRGNKMVVVRWFHKADEVDFVLPHKFSDREVFFSLCLQDLSIECIDGLATVLSPQHFEKFSNVARGTMLQPYVCRKQFENDDVKPFDITQVKGYWKQEILRHMYTTSPSKAHGLSQQSDSAEDDDLYVKPRKKHRRSKDDDLLYKSEDLQDAACLSFSNSLVEFKSKSEIASQNDGVFASRLLPKKEVKQNPLWYLTVGSQVELLSQDSGMRGCWFRAVIIKKHKDKVKVRYHDIQDADDDSNKLEEWIKASRITSPDQLGLRIFERPTIRPFPQFRKGRVSWVVDIGTVVDVWWHDGWWEGIVVQRESEGKLHVYFPGEKQEAIFSRGDLRHSEEWMGNEWVHLKERPDIVSTLPRNRKFPVEASDGKSSQIVVCNSRQTNKDEYQITDTFMDSANHKLKELDAVPDLSKDDSLADLRWRSSKKRNRIFFGSPLQKPHLDDNHSKKFLDSWSSLKVDHDNCKNMEDSLFCSSVVPPLTSLVMSR